jgi:hypothetical protein
MALDMTEDQQVEYYLARKFYLRLMKHRGKEPLPAPFAPEWAYEYAAIAHEALGHDEDAIAVLESQHR